MSQLCSFPAHTAALCEQVHPLCMRKRSPAFHAPMHHAHAMAGAHTRAHKYPRTCTSVCAQSSTHKQTRAHTCTYAHTQAFMCAHERLHPPRDAHLGGRGVPAVSARGASGWRGRAWGHATGGAGRRIPAPSAQPGRLAAPCWRLCGCAQPRGGVPAGPHSGRGLDGIPVRCLGALPVGAGRAEGGS